MPPTPPTPAPTPAPTRRAALRGRAAWLAAVLAAGAAGGTLATRAPAPPAATFVVPTGIVADADLDHAANGTDNAPAIQAAVNAASAAGLPVQLPPGKYPIRSTVVISPAVNFTLAGTEAGRGGPDDVTRGTWLVWAGAPNGTAALLGGIKCTVRDLGVTCCRDTSLDRCFDMEAPDAPPWLSSQHYFQNVVAYGLNGPVAKGWVVGDDQRPNNEFHWWRSCTARRCTYAGIHVPSGTFQSKNNVCEDCTFGGPGAYGVAVATGSFSFWRCNFDALDYAVKWWGGAYEPVQFISCTGESNRVFAAMGGCQYVLLDGCRLALNKADSPQVFGDEFLSGGANWSVRCCTAEDPDDLNGWWRPGDGATACVDGMQCHSALPLTTDDLTTWKGDFRNFRRDQGNNMVANGAYYQRNNLTQSALGPSMVLGSGHWPPAGTYGGGTYYPGPGEALLKWDSGRLWVQTWDGKAWRSRQVQLDAAAPAGRGGK